MTSVRQFDTPKAAFKYEEGDMIRQLRMLKEDMDDDKLVDLKNCGKKEKVKISKEDLAMYMVLMKQKAHQMHSSVS